MTSLMCQKIESSNAELIIGPNKLIQKTPQNCQNTQFYLVMQEISSYHINLPSETSIYRYEWVLGGNFHGIFSNCVIWPVSRVFAIRSCSAPLYICFI